MGACFNRSTWSPARNLQQLPPGTSHLILGDSLVRISQNLRTSWITTVMKFVHLYRMVELMNPGRIGDIMDLIDTYKVSKCSAAEEAQ